VFLLGWLISLALRAAIYLVIGSVLLTLVGQILRPRWINHPLVQLVIALGYGIYAPFRYLMRRLGIPTRPIDFSPLVAILALEFLGWLAAIVLR
jgi:uncharacterized protein YggT (Ycf19 family)